MRRTQKLSKNIVIFLLMAAFFNLLSYSLDQLIVQGEDKVRRINNQLQKSRNTVSNYSNSLNIFQNLTYELSYESAMLSSTLGFNYKSRNIFKLQNNPDGSNPDELGFEITDEKLIENSEKLSKFYSTKIDQHIDILNHKAKQFHQIFKENFSSGQTYELLKAGEKFRNYIKEPLFFINKSELETFEDSFNQFNFVWNYLDILYDTEDVLLDFEAYIQSEYLFSVAKYFDVLDRYSSQNNINNYLILSSILAQILGLFFLLLLFRTLIKENY